MSKQANLIAVPLIVEGNVPIVELEFEAPSGATRQARFMVDTGASSFVIGSTLMQDTAANPVGRGLESHGMQMVPLQSLPAKLGGMSLDFSKVQVLGLPDNKWVGERNEAEGLIPGLLFCHYDVVFDYPERQFILAKPGTSKLKGVSVATPISTANAFPRIEVEMGGNNYGFLLDTGASFTMISRAALGGWSRENPTWSSAVGAVGFANMFGGEMENAALMLRIPELRLGAVAVKGAAAVSRPEGVFEKWMSDMMTAPIIGALGGNVLRNFCVGIDYKNGLTHLHQSGTCSDADLVSIGLVLRAEPDGSLLITTVCSTASSDVKDAVHPGDRLLAVDDVPLSGRSLVAAATALQAR